jgi:hypothetical protein
MERKPFDYGIIVVILLIVGIILAYKPAMNFIKKTKSGTESAGLVVEGKEIFYDPMIWGRENRSCAMCHAEDFTLAPGFDKVDMKDAGQIRPLKNIRKTFGIGVIGDTQKLQDQINRCLSSGSRIESGKLNYGDRRLEPLMAYVMSL